MPNENIFLRFFPVFVRRKMAKVFVLLFHAVPSHLLGVLEEIAKEYS
jgi:hypothetical protein